MLEKLSARDGQGSARFRHRWHDILERAADEINSIYAASDGASVVLISDSLVEDGQPTSASREIIDAHEGRPFAMIAVTPDGRRVPEIHRTLRSNVNDEDLVRAVEVSLNYLRYVSRPSPAGKNLQLKIRQLRTQAELQKYYAMRYRIYQIMGYLKHEVEQAPTRLEIDACDEYALHVGAFDHKQGYEVLAGTARLVIGSVDFERRQRGHTAKHTLNLIQSDPVLRTTIDDRVLQLMLPVFQSQELNEDLTTVLIDELDCGELSRVIVDEPYRGTGLSLELVQFCIDLARQHNLHKLYLECLKIHVPLYNSLGFEEIPGKRGRVVGVSKTMLPMQMLLHQPPRTSLVPR